MGILKIPNYKGHVYKYKVEFFNLEDDDQVRRLGSSNYEIGNDQVRSPRSKNEMFVRVGVEKMFLMKGVKIRPGKKYQALHMRWLDSNDEHNLVTIKKRSPEACFKIIDEFAEGNLNTAQVVRHTLEIVNDNEPVMKFSGEHEFEPDFKNPVIFDEIAGIKKMIARDLGISEDNIHVFPLGLSSSKTFRYEEAKRRNLSECELRERADKLIETLPKPFQKLVKRKPINKNGEEGC